VVARGRGGARRAVGVAQERRQEKMALVPFVPKRLTRRGGGKGGSDTGTTHSEGGA
jgi:hypothetical protein